MDAKVRAWLYTWGHGRVTQEGEHVPLRVEAMEMPAIEALLLTPIVLEHTIDERSPLHNLSHDDLVRRQAEVVVTFEATSDFGDSFMVRRSYLANEICWGFVFVPIVSCARKGALQHTADLSKFHNVQPEEELPPNASQSVVSRIVLSPQTQQAPKTLPYPALGSNTLVVSNACTTFTEGDVTYLLFRVGDTRQGQMLEAHVRGFLYEWRPGALQSRFSAPYTVTVRF